MYRPSKLAILLGLIAVAAAAIVPLDPNAADAPLNFTLKPTDGDSIQACDIHYEVYEEDGCGGGTSKGLCGALDNCRDLKGMGSKSITVGNNMHASVTVTAYRDFGCNTEIQKVVLSQSTAACLRFEPSFYSIKAVRTPHQKSCRQACILFLFAVATTEAADGGVLFLHEDRGEYHVSAGLNCTNFPGWINDQSFQYSIDKYYNCVVFEHAGCSGQSATIGPTNDWTNVPFPGISAIICWN
ncbi:hypothetical protein F5H01DRAFT_370850 [Linnemannia elongata]|nr:hypothetical protein F5H01DRAFT_370850 [Linnemannia elongata]